MISFHSLPSALPSDWIYLSKWTCLVLQANNPHRGFALFLKSHSSTICKTLFNQTNGKSQQTLIYNQVCVLCILCILCGCPCVWLSYHSYVPVIHACRRRCSCRYGCSYSYNTVKPPSKLTILYSHTHHALSLLQQRVFAIHRTKAQKHRKHQ